MGYKISVTDLAVQDLDTIVEYISGELDNPTAASAFLDAVDACYEDLMSMPLMFERCRNPRLRDLGYRRDVIKHYVMVYRVAESEHTVYILRFFYGSRDYEKLI